MTMVPQSNIGPIVSYEQALQHFEKAHKLYYQYPPSHYVEPFCILVICITSVTRKSAAT